jgi:hypothetical protein
MQQHSAWKMEIATPVLLENDSRICDVLRTGVWRTDKFPVVYYMHDGDMSSNRMGRR